MSKETKIREKKKPLFIEAISMTLAAYSHIEASRIELVHFLFPAANTAGGEE